MTSRTGRGRWERVLAARRQARAALGHDPVGRDLYAALPKPKTVPTPVQGTNVVGCTTNPYEWSERILSVGESRQLGLAFAETGGKSRGRRNRCVGDWLPTNDPASRDRAVDRQGHGSSLTPTLTPTGARD